MKQEIISYLSTLKNEVFSLSKFLHDNPEQSFKEYNSLEYISGLLKNHEFNIIEHYLDIPTAFLASKGKGGPKICFIMNYSAFPEGHTNGNNFFSAVSYAAGVGLSKVLDKVKGTVNILGCPGEIFQSSVLVMLKQGAFDDIDAVFSMSPDIVTMEPGSSPSTLPLKFTFEKAPLSCDNKGLDKEHAEPDYDTVDSLLLFLNSLKFIIPDKCKSCKIMNINVSECCEKIILTFELSGFKLSFLNEIEKKLEVFKEAISSLMNVRIDINLSSLPCESMVTNSTMFRLFSHNLKESGIIDMDGIKSDTEGICLGSVSHKVPCIRPYIAVTDNKSIKKFTKEFADATLSEFAKDRMYKLACAFADTAFDLISNTNLLNEAKSELKKSSNLK